MNAETIHRWLERTAAKHGEKTAITFVRGGRAETELTYGQLLRDVNRLAHTFVDMGVSKGDRVVISLSKSVAAVWPISPRRPRAPLPCH